MSLRIRKLNLDDCMEIYEMLQELPADENGFINPAAGKSFDEYKEWLVRAVQCSEQTEIIDGWKVPETIFWFFEDERPIGYGKLRHCLTDRLLVEGGKLGIDKFLLTIRSANQASIHVALANGGQIEKTTEERSYIWI